MSASGRAASSFAGALPTSKRRADERAASPGCGRLGSRRRVAGARTRKRHRCVVRGEVCLAAFPAHAFGLRLLKARPKPVRLVRSAPNPRHQELFALGSPFTLTPAAEASCARAPSLASGTLGGSCPARSRCLHPHASLARLTLPWPSVLADPRPSPRLACIGLRLYRRSGVSEPGAL